MDRDLNTPDVSCVRGFTGQIVGVFFGLTGEEIGGTVTASYDLTGDANDLNMYDDVAGER